MYLVVGREDKGWIPENKVGNRKSPFGNGTSKKSPL